MSPQKALQLLMAALKHNGSTATFFVTGKYYEQNPKLVSNFVEQGFEVGYHGHTHIKLQSKDIFDSELEKSARFLQAIQPIGFRAPWIYLPTECMEQLTNHGFQYDSSTFGPVGSCYQRNNLTIFPVSSLCYFGTDSVPIYPKTAGLRMLRREFPIGSGIFVSWLRHGYQIFLNNCTKQHKPVVLYLHDWQLAERKGMNFSLFKDKLRYIHKFPMLNCLLHWVEQQPFAHLGSRLQTKDDTLTKHHLTIDVEQLENNE